MSSAHPKRQVFPLALSPSEASLPYLSLGMVTAYLKSVDDGELLSHYQVEPIALGGIPGYKIMDLYPALEVSETPLVLLSSYVWNHQLNMSVARQIKNRNPAALIIVGGPEIPKWVGESEAFLEANPAVDIAVLGEGEVACAEILTALAQGGGQADLATISGLVYRKGDELIRTDDRDRVRDLELLPSPYLGGEFDQWIQQVPTATLETNRGCPYGCTYCDWGSATLEKVSRFSLPRVEREIEYLARNRVESIFIADANFGMLEQDIAVAQALVDAREQYGFPQRLYSNFAKNGGRRLMAVIAILNKGGLLPTGIIALQTTDEHSLEVIQRDNIRTSSYEKMMEYFNAEGIPMASDLMIGLPGQTVDGFHEDLQFCFDWKVSANGNYTSMMPNAPMAEASYRREHAIETDSDDMICSSGTFTADELIYMRKLYLCYQLMVRMALLKYFLYFVQIDHGIAAIDFLRRWLDRAISAGGSYPLSERIYRDMLEPAAKGGHWPHVTWDDSAEFLFGDLQGFYSEILAFAEAEYDLSLSQTERDAIFAAQASVQPSTGHSYPHRVALQHDVVAYFEQLRPVASLRGRDIALKPLASLAAGAIEVGEDGQRFDSIAMQTMLGHSDEGWELNSPLRFY